MCVGVCVFGAAMDGLWLSTRSSFAGSIAQNQDCPVVALRAGVSSAGLSSFGEWCSFVFVPFHLRSTVDNANQHNTVLT